MRSPSIIIALLLLAATAFAGNDSPIAGRILTVNDIKTSYALPCGATSFVIRLANQAQDRSFTFVNENVTAKGRLSIAVSNQSLAPDSPQWSTVEGTIRFRHKRLFTVSLVGIDAHFVRLTFEVEKPAGNGRNDSSIDHT